MYVGPSTLPEGEVSAALCGDLELPVREDPDAPWDGGKARTRVLDWAAGDDGTVDPDKLAAAFLYCDDDVDPTTTGAYELGFADVFSRDGADRLEVVAAGVDAVASVLQGGMGGARGLPEANLGPEGEGNPVNDHEAPGDCMPSDLLERRKWGQSGKPRGTILRARNA
ncbi:hypothetical protein ACFXJ5_08650 [Streptomyces sp. NPDC059373]